MRGGGGCQASRWQVEGYYIVSSWECGKDGRTDGLVIELFRQQISHERRHGPETSGNVEWKLMSCLRPNDKFTGCGRIKCIGSSARV